MDATVIRVVDDWLKANNKHISSHERGPDSYCYINEDGYDYTDHLSGPCSVQEAFEEGWFWLTEDGIHSCCSHQIPTLPLSFDFPKIRRRIEDRLRKSVSEKELLRIATELDITIL